MSRVEKLFGNTVVGGKQPDIVNMDGFPAFKVSLEEDYVQMVMTNTIGNTYYMSSQKLFDKSMELHALMLKKDPKFMAQTAIYGRNASLMRTQPIIAVAFLSTIPDKTYFNAAFNRVIKTPQDLIDFVTIVGSIRNGRGLGRSVKRAVNSYLNTLNQYRVIKYGGGKSGWTLKDIVKACHPKPVTRTLGSLFNYLSTGERCENLEQIECIEALKKLDPEDKNYNKKVVELIERGKLPYEIVTGIVKPNKEIWEYLMKQMPIFALTRNLNTLDRAGVFQKPENVKYVVEKLTNKDIIRNSRMLPFRFVKACREFRGDLKITNALHKALDLSLDNAQVIPGNTAWFLDTSGSMSGDYLEIGGILALAGLKQSAESQFFCFESNLHYPRVNPDNSVMSNLDIVKRVDRGGTATDLCLKHLLGRVKCIDIGRAYWSDGYYDINFPESLKTKEPIKVDNIVIVTDEQQNAGSPVVRLFREYRSKVNRNAKLFIIDVAPYSGRLANDDEPGVTFIYGWSDAVLDILRYSVEGNTKHVELIRQIQL